MKPDIKVYNANDFLTEDEFNNLLIERYNLAKELEENKNKPIPNSVGESGTITLTSECYDNPT